MTQIGLFVRGERRHASVSSRDGPAIETIDGEAGTVKIHKSDGGSCWNGPGDTTYYPTRYAVALNGARVLEAKPGSRWRSWLKEARQLARDIADGRVRVIWAEETAQGIEKERLRENAKQERASDKARRHAAIERIGKQIPYEHGSTGWLEAVAAALDGHERQP